ncbi:hypothetical protein B296_00022932 [Ensete ventricosum]|uniref:Uncharacterized protein n=1 Tax=Ensete ventricosum TaxID=4639 RepID=A0A426ZLB9_ENSVE|nr:hypothetical protein B296_00022932 [Ensete ventricosum]
MVGVNLPRQASMLTSIGVKTSSLEETLTSSGIFRDGSRFPAVNAGSHCTPKRTANEKPRGLRAEHSYEWSMMSSGSPISIEVLPADLLRAFSTDRAESGLDALAS